MAILPVLHYPDSRLKTIARPVEKVTTDIQRLVDDMFETMYHGKGIGLAATQVNVHQRVIVMDVQSTSHPPLHFINPEILDKQGEEISEEGCLSVPWVYEKVCRAAHLTVRALNKEGETFTLKAEGLLAICIQHEIDHLNGTLFIDYLSPLKKERAIKKMEKLKRRTI
ncbi:MAG: peptide deformylase [Gammaproteobacteria bacterium]|nr:peptide deformylase [Gammaproteobacteria bacterium]